MVGTPAGRLVLGTVQWGLPYGIANTSGLPSDADVSSILCMAADAGITTLDTARAYGASEETIGRLLEPSSGWRIITKLAPDVYEEGMPLDESLARIRSSVATSERMLRRKRFDLLLHRAEHRLVHDGALWRELIGMRERGEVGELGVSVRSVQEAFACLEDQDVTYIQVPTSLFDQRFLRAGFFDQARAAGKEVFVRSIFLQGVAFLEPAELPEHLSSLAQPLREIRSWTEKRGREIGWAFLNFVSCMEGTWVIVGVEDPAQLDRNISFVEQGDNEELQGLALDIPDLPVEALDPSLWNPR